MRIPLLRNYNSPSLDHVLKPQETSAQAFANVRLILLSHATTDLYKSRPAHTSNSHHCRANTVTEWMLSPAFSAVSFPVYGLLSCFF